MANILIISALQVFPPVSGGNYRTAMIAKGLARFGHSVRVHSLLGRKYDMIRGRQKGTSKIGERIVEYVQRPKRLWIEAMISYKRNQAPFWANRSLNNPSTQLHADAKWADVILFDFPFSYCDIANTNHLTILNTHNIETNIFSDTEGRERKKATKVADLEIQAVKNVNLVCCASTEELTHFSKTAPNQQFIQIPNCIDRGRFHNISKHREIIRKKFSINKSTRVLLFPASRYGPNQDGFEFLRDFVTRTPCILDELDLTIIVTGSVTKKQINTGRLLATGPVPAIEPYFGAADWGLNPLFRGSGTSIKVAEMIAAKLPLLTTAIGARGFDLEDHKDAIFFSRESFAETLKNLPNNSGAINQLTTSAESKNLKYLDPESAVRSLHQAIEKHYEISSPS